ncbi:MAG: hypothetical protein M1313_05640 [Nitrospirae bacterium]|nr:hypothetical protein [Nitrospirota bacterium]
MIHDHLFSGDRGHFDKTLKRDGTMISSCSLCDRFADASNPLIVFKSQKVALYHMPGIDLPGYLVISPFRHVEDAGVLEDSEREEMARLQSRAVQTILGLPGVRKVYILSFGEAVPHLHLHLFPRTDAMLAGPGCLSDGIPDGPKIFDFWRKRLAGPDIPDTVQSLIPRLREIFR